MGGCACKRRPRALNHVCLRAQALLAREQASQRRRARRHKVPVGWGGQHISLVDWH
jgi:hypothetical protein